MQAARGAFEDGWSSLRPAERAKYLFRIARLLQERSRELAVAESLDGGKPIKESRDVDLPLAAAHFFYYAGWADKLEYAFPNRQPRPLGVAGQIIPWNFPLLMLAWKIAPALACGNTVVLKPAETTPLTALIFADICRQAELPPGVVNIVTGDGSTGAHLVKHPGVDKVAFTGSTEVGKAIQRELAGHRRQADARARRQGGEHRLRRLRARPGGRGDRQRHLLQPGPRLLRGLAAARAGVDRRAARREAEAAAAHAAGRRPARQEHRHRRDQLADAARPDPRARREREEEGAEIYQPPCALPEKGYWFAPTVFTDVAQSYRIAQEEIFGPVLSRADVPDARRGGREGEQHAVRALGRRLDGEGLADPLDGRAAPRRRRLGEHVQPLRPDLAVRRLQGVGLRPRRRPPRARGVPEVRAMSRLAGRKTYKLFIGGAFPRSESGRTYEAEGQNVARASRKDARDAVMAARGAFPAGRARPPYNRGQVLYRLAEMMEARAADLAAACSGRDEVERAIDRVVWYAGWADKLPQVLGGSNPVAGPYFNFTVPEPTGRRRDPRAGGAGARRARLPARARDRRRQRGRRRRVRDGARSPRSSSRRRSRPRTCPAASSTSSPGPQPSSRRCSPRTWT